MTYEIIITKTIQKQLDNLPNNIQERVYEKIAQLAQTLKRSKMLSAEQLELVKQIDTFYQQHAGDSVKKLSQ
jgi:mRNA-degrading endonuclease RelE of RelBE toxin-antitoxin system